jgi:hypothetical protein
VAEGQSARNVDVQVRRLELGVKPYPQREVHLLRACAGDVTEIHHFLPAESGFEDADDFGLRPFVVARDEHRVDARYDRGVGHHSRGHRVERLHDLGHRERALNLFAKRIGVADQKCGRHPLGEVERIGDIDQNFPLEILRARRIQRFERGPSRCAVEYHVAMCSRVGKRSLGALRACLLHPRFCLLAAGGA